MTSENFLGKRGNRDDLLYDEINKQTERNYLGNTEVIIFVVRMFMPQ